MELSLYDSKPFYFMSNACEVVKWNKMTRKVWTKEKNRMVEMPFFCLNMIYDYIMTSLYLGILTHFFFCNQTAPKTYLDQNLCPLNARVMALLDQVVSKNHTIGMDNIYISAKFVRFGLWHPDRFIFHGVAREKGKVVPSCIFQKKETTKIDHAKAR